MLQRVVFAFLMASVVSVSVCGCDGGAEFIPVTGSVKYADGSPVTGQAAMVVFYPDRSALNTGGAAASGSIEADGSFNLMTKHPGDGAHPGAYKVVLRVWRSYRNQTLAVPREYANEATTPLQAEISADQHHFDWVIDR